MDEAQVEAGRLAFTVAAARIERDVRLSELTPEEERALVVAILEATRGDPIPVYRTTDATDEFVKPEK